LKVKSQYDAPAGDFGFRPGSPGGADKPGVLTGREAEPGSFLLDTIRRFANNKAFSRPILERRPAMTFWWKSFLISAVLFFLFMGSSAVAYLETGAPAPDFKATNLQGEKVSLSDYKGKIIVLKLGTTWCPDCSGMTADIMAIGQFLKENDVVVVDVFIQETAKTVADYLQGKDFAMTYVPLLDNGQAHQAYQVYLIPRVVIINQNFEVVHDGLRIPVETLREKINALGNPSEGLAEIK
jgi:thiol-disulfide isomerase/thioredoxin